MGVTTLLLIFCLLPRSLTQYAPMDSCRRDSLPTSEFAKPVLILFLAYFLENRRNLIGASEHAHAGGYILFWYFSASSFIGEPDLGNGNRLRRNCGGCSFYVAGMRMRYFGYAFAASLPALYLLIFFTLAGGAIASWRFLNPYADRPEVWVPHHPIADCGGHRRGDWTRLDGRQAETFLPARTAHRFIFAVTAEELGLLGAVFVAPCLPSFSGAACGRAGARKTFRTLSRGRHHQHGCAAGLHQHQRRARHDADQRDPAPTGFLRRILVVCHAGMRWRPVEHHQASGITID